MTCCILTVIFYKYFSKISCIINFQNAAKYANYVALKKEGVFVSKKDDVRIGELLSHARNKKGMTQQDVADVLGVSRRAIQAWEKGEHPIPFAKAVEYFSAIGEPPKPYLHRYMYGEPKKNTKKSREELIERCFEHIRQLTDHDLECFDWIMSDEHGSSSTAYLQKTVADLQSPLGSRLTSCVLITTSYENAKEMGQLTDPNAVQPNVDLLQRAALSAVEAYRKNMNSYAGSLSFLLKEK